MGALGFSLTVRAERAVTVSPAEQTKQLKVISPCSHTHHRPLTKLLFAETQLHRGSRCCRRDNKGTRCRTDEIWQGPGEAGHREGESLLPGGNEEVGRRVLHGSKRELPPCSPSLTVHPPSPPSSSLSRFLPTPAAVAVCLSV